MKYLKDSNINSGRYKFTSCSYNIIDNKCPYFKLVKRNHKKEIKTSDAYKYLFKCFFQAKSWKDTLVCIADPNIIYTGKK